MSNTTVAVVGSGAAAEAVRAALADADVTVTDTSPSDLDASLDLAVVVGRAGSADFRRADERARDVDLPWIAVELGGVGGYALDGVDASVTAFGPESGCFTCLSTRVAADADPQDVQESPSVSRSAIRLAGAHAGSRAVRALAGTDVSGTVLELPHAERAFLPVPNCDDCGDTPDRELDLDDADVPDLQGALERAERAVDDRVGVVQAVGERESFPAPYYLAQLCDTSGFSDAEARRQAAGVAAGWDRAYMKAIGEGLERYSAGVYRTADFERALADRDDGVSVERFVRPEGYETPAPDDTLQWVGGVDLHDGTDAALPAEFVVFPPHEERFGPAITTGLGLGGSTVDALLSGLYETVERDATMLAWYSTFEPLGLQVTDADPEFAELAKRARSEGLTVTPLLVTQDVDVPVVAVTVHRADGEWPCFAAGSSADLNAAAAARGALAEALQNWMELRAMGEERAAGEEGAIARYADFPREVRGFVDPETTVPVDSVGAEEPPSGRAELDAVLDALDGADLDAYAARLSPRDVEQLGFEAVRVLVPEAQPLFVDVDEPFFGERARQVPRELGFRPQLSRPFHPYP
ncbi:YcaO-like family protein [Halospeciosus flavus]|uniref:YcaO-like family protein n=1 Tax=Halospeciosus flavus TaxID=3032283 RepID=A0ABD5Z8Z9_9EURY|nr:YcaO-like family protein [Halospeciosus flavus]